MRKLSPTQRKIVEQLAASPLSWVGSDSSFRLCVVLPPNLNGCYGLLMSIATMQALTARGVISHGKLHEEQRAEFNRRRTKYHPTLKTHGYLVNRDKVRKLLEQDN